MAVQIAVDRASAHIAAKSFFNPVREVSPVQGLLSRSTLSSDAAIWSHSIGDDR